MEPVSLHWLRGSQGPVSWGLPWPRGLVKKEDSFVLENERGRRFAVQSRVRAYWPDGSVKWTLHSACAQGERFTINKGTLQAPSQLDVCDNDLELTISCDRLRVVFPKDGAAVPRIFWKGQCLGSGGRLIVKIQSPEEDTYTDCADQIILEEEGPLRAVVKICGRHRNQAGKELLPFTLRYYLYADQPDIRLVHTFIHDADPFQERIAAIGVQFDAPLSGPIYNRHVRIAGDQGYLKEACVLLNSWKPKLPAQWYHSQICGDKLQLDPQRDAEAFQAMDNMTWWDEWRITQDSSEHYRIQKETGEEDCSAVDGPEGRRSGGLLYAAGLALAMKDFWQKYPSSLEVKGMLSDKAVLSAWIWPPDAPAMDLRPYTRRPCSQSYYGQGDTSRSMPSGIGMTTELHIVAAGPATPSDGELDQWQQACQKGALLAADPAYYHQVRSFGVWSLPQKDTSVQRALEERLEDTITFYQKEIEQRKWYGLFNYGDFMHTYDNERHSWRYDLGGWAWQNTELVPTFWLWYMFLRSGREDIFTMAEAMCRHTSEVDIHHSGPFAGLGSRHNVKHWGGAAKEARISMAAHHRFYYYLTGDERVGDIMDEVKDADLTTKTADPLRNYYQLKGTEPYCTHARTGPDWSSYCGNWMTRWERFQDDHYKEKMLRGIEGIAAAPYRLLSGSDFGYDPDTGAMYYIGEQSTGGSHLALCMGEPQMYFELEQMLEDPRWKEMLVQYGSYYYLTPEEKLAASNEAMAGKGWGLPMTAASIVAYAAKEKKDHALGREVWDCLLAEPFKKPERAVEYVTGKIQERPGISTNTCSQWCLNVITALELVGDDLPEELPREPAEKFFHWRG